MKTFELQHAIWLPRPVEEVFPFFADASNLSVLTPDWLEFTVLSEMPVEMAAGVTIDYRLRVRHIPLKWTSRIRRWDPPHAFVDEQIRGPYRFWVHEHQFEPVNEGTRVSDHVRYSVWGGRIVNRFLVEPDLARIFQFRTARLLGRFGTRSHIGGMPPDV